jgi:hypothetical protein
MDRKDDEMLDLKIKILSLYFFEEMIYYRSIEKDGEVEQHHFSWVFQRLRLAVSRMFSSGLVSHCKKSLYKGMEEKIGHKIHLHSQDENELSSKALTSKTLTSKFLIAKLLTIENRKLMCDVLRRQIEAYGYFIFDKKSEKFNEFETVKTLSYLLKVDEKDRFPTYGVAESINLINYLSQLHYCIIFAQKSGLIDDEMKMQLMNQHGKLLSSLYKSGFASFEKEQDEEKGYWEKIYNEKILASNLTLESLASLTNAVNNFPKEIVSIIISYATLDDDQLCNEEVQNLVLERTLRFS